VDADGNFPFQKAARHGNCEAIAWIFKTWKANGKEIDINDLNKEGYTALMACCVYGKCSGDSNSVESEKIKKDRLDCCKLLIEMKSNVNFTSEKEMMTPLHWAAYHNDFEVCKLLLS